MSRSAIATGSADYVVPAEQMADVLLTYVRHASSSAAGSEAPDHLASVLTLLRGRTKFDFRAYKKGTLQRRIHRRHRGNGCRFHRHP